MTLPSPGPAPPMVLPSESELAVLIPSVALPSPAAVPVLFVPI